MSFIKTEIIEQVAIITISRPEALNALNLQVLEDLEQAFDQIDLDQIRCIILTGEGDRSFVAGADISEMLNMDQSAAIDFGQMGNKLFRKIELFPLPIIAAINGFCMGGGNELAMACDIRLASDNSIFGQPEVGLGITPGFGGTQRLARVIGSVSKTKEILYTGNTIKADEALAIGLVSSIHPQEELMDAALNMAKKIAQNAPIAVRNTKQAVNQGLDTDIEAALEIESQLFGACFASEDQKEGMMAFLEKRKEKHFNNK